MKTDLREQPIQSSGRPLRSGEDESRLLPTLAFNAGLELRSVEFKIDPYVLYDRYGYLLYECDNE